MRVPHPGVAEGRPLVDLGALGTHYACPDLKAGGITPLIADACLTPGDLSTTRYDGYSMLQPSVECGDGRRATDAGDLGFGFVDEPLIPQRGAAPSRVAVLDCLRILPPF